MLIVGKRRSVWCWRGQFLICKAQIIRPLIWTCQFSYNFSTWKRFRSLSWKLLADKNKYLICKKLIHLNELNQSLQIHDLKRQIIAMSQVTQVTNFRQNLKVETTYKVASLKIINRSNQLTKRIYLLVLWGEVIKEMISVQNSTRIFVCKLIGIYSSKSTWSFQWKLWR